MIMSKKEKLKIGNFLVSKEGNEIERIKIESVSGNWSIKIPNFNMQFKLFEHLSKNEELHAYFGAYINIMFMACNCMPDLKFMEDFYSIYTSLADRQTSTKEPTEEEDKADIEAAKEIYKLQKEAEKENSNKDENI